VLEPSTLIILSAAMADAAANWMANKAAMPKDLRNTMLIKVPSVL